MRISALGMMGGGRQNCSLYAVRGTNGDTGGGQTESETPLGRNGPTWGFKLTLIVDVEEPPLLVVTTETYQHLIGRAARRLVGLPVSEDSQFPGRLLRTVPKGGGKNDYGVCLSVGIFSRHPRPRFHAPSLKTIEHLSGSVTHNWETSKKNQNKSACQIAVMRLPDVDREPDVCRWS